jgi:hypothetical protein
MPEGTGYAPVFASMSTMNGIDEFDLDQEYEDWDWARTAGVSADDLREALRNSLDGAELPPKIAKAA